MNSVTSDNCPGCGGPISSIDTACRYCGSDLKRTAGPRLSPTKLLLARLDELSRAAGTNSVEQVLSKQTRARAIEDFPIPDDKGDVLEMLAVAVGNTGRLLEAEEIAWGKKARQLLTRTTIHAANDPDYARMALALRDQLAAADARLRRFVRALLFGLLLFALVLVAIAIGKSLSS